MRLPQREKIGDPSTEPWSILKVYRPRRGISAKNTEKEQPMC